MYEVKAAEIYARLENDAYCSLYLFEDMMRKIHICKMKAKIRFVKNR